MVYFSLGQGDDYIYRGKLDFCGIHLEDKLGPSINQQKLFDIQEVYEIFPEYYLIKVNNFNDVAKDTLDEWIYFLKKSQIKEEFTAQGLAEAKENLLVDSLSEQERANYLRYMENRRYEVSMIEGSRSVGRLEGIEEGMEKGIKEGIEQGKKQAEIDIARTLKRKGTDFDTIVEATGLTREEIEKL